MRRKKWSQTKTGALMGRITTSQVYKPAAGGQLQAVLPYLMGRENWCDTTSSLGDWRDVERNSVNNLMWRVIVEAWDDEVGAVTKWIFLKRSAKKGRWLSLRLEVQSRNLFVFLSLLEPDVWKCKEKNSDGFFFFFSIQGLRNLMYSPAGRQHALGFLNRKHLHTDLGFSALKIKSNIWWSMAL